MQVLPPGLSNPGAAPDWARNGGTALGQGLSTPTLPQVGLLPPGTDAPTPEPDIPLVPKEELVPTLEPEAGRFLLISVPYQSLVKFCSLLRDFLQFLRDQLG